MPWRQQRGTALDRASVVPHGYHCAFAFVVCCRVMQLRQLLIWSWPHTRCAAAPQSSAGAFSVPLCVVPANRRVKIVWCKCSVSGCWQLSAVAARAPVTRQSCVPPTQDGGAVIVLRGYTHRKITVSRLPASKHARK